MNANYFKQFLENYQKDNSWQKKYCSFPSGVTIRDKNIPNDKVVYNINGNVTTRKNLETEVEDVVPIESLTSDYEFYSDITQYKTYYLHILDGHDPMDIITAIEDKDSKVSPGYNGGYRTMNIYGIYGVSAIIYNIEHIIKINESRKYYGLRCLPFDKDYDSRSNAYVAIRAPKYRYTDEQLEECTQDILRRIEDALEEAGISALIVECKQSNSIYV